MNDSSQDRLRSLRGWGWTATAFTFLVIFTGGLVRVSGAGLGCPDWPRCFGRWLPPTSVDQLPPHVDASLFNFTLAWIEYGNRLLGATLGLIILITAILAIVKARRHRSVWIPAVAAALLVAYVGWQGGQVVASALEPVLVAVHALLSIGIALLLLYMCLQLGYLKNPEAERIAVYPVRMHFWTGWLFGGAIVQAAIGTQLRGAIKIIQEIEPLGGHSDWTAAVAPLLYSHQMLGILVVALAGHVGVKLLRRSVNPTPMVRQASLGVTAVAGLQLVLGLTMLFAGYFPFLQVFHLWMTALLLGLILVLHVSMRRNFTLASATGKTLAGEHLEIVHD